jgi:hypothetical protein
MRPLIPSQPLEFSTLQRAGFFMTLLAKAIPKTARISSRFGRPRSKCMYLKHNLDGERENDKDGWMTRLLP